MLSPLALWLLLFTLIPIGIVAYFSFMTRGPWGTIIHEFTFDNYREVLDPLCWFSRCYMSGGRVSGGVLDCVLRRTPQKLINLPGYRAVLDQLPSPDIQLDDSAIRSRVD